MEAIWKQIYFHGSWTYFHGSFHRSSHGNKATSMAASTNFHGSTCQFPWKYMEGCPTSMRLDLLPWNPLSMKAATNFHGSKPSSYLISSNFHFTYIDARSTSIRSIFLSKESPMKITPTYMQANVTCMEASMEVNWK